MICKNLKINDEFPSLKTDAVIKTYIQEYSSELNILNRPAMIIFPGGGYSMCSDREAEPVALAFASKGYQCFVVYYSVSTARYPLQLLEAAAAVTIVKNNADQWGIDINNVFTIGFSAGGHLCGSVQTMYNHETVTSALGISDTYARPTGSILCYPVVTGGEYAHRGSFDHLLGDDKDNPQMLDFLSLENRVTPDTPPAFIWSTFDDNVVNCQNALKMASAMKENGVPFELHIYGSGTHGLSLSNRTVYSNQQTELFYPRIKPRIARWVDEADSWLHETFDLLV